MIGTSSPHPSHAFMAQTMEAQCDTLPRTLRKHFAVLVTDVCAQAATRASLRAGNAAAAAHTAKEGCPSDPPLPNTRENDTPATACSTQTCCSVQATPKRLLAFGSAIGCWPVYGSGSPYYRPFTSEFTSRVVAGVSPTTPEPPRRSSSPAPPAPRNSERNLCPEAPCHTILSSTAESSYFPKTTHSNDPKEHQLMKRVEEMGRQLEALKVKSSRPFERDFTTDPPFSARVMSEPIPMRFKMPQTELYDGTSDPLDHLESFKALMLLHGANDGVMCRAFPATLRKSARLWFSGLHPGSINSFEQLGRLFTAHFISSRRQRRGSDFLIGIKQESNESL